MAATGKVTGMEEEQERFLYHQGAALLEELGLKQYEISISHIPDGNADII